jgi:hypothetical protein
VAPQVGLYGNQYQLQVDISRIPRFDELDALLQVASPPAGYASDLRTVAYYLQQGDYVDESSTAATAIGEGESLLQRSGLMRRETDRATALYSTQFGGSALMAEKGTLVAPEVTWIEFQYFDGTQLWSEWDSSISGGLPMAVEVTIWLRPRRSESDVQETTAPAASNGPGQNDEMYRIVVHLPAAEPTSAAGSSASAGGTAGSTSGSSTSGGQ